MTFILVGASLILALVALAHVKFADFSDPTRLLVSCLAYGFVPAAVGYAMAIVNHLAGRGRTHAEFIEDVEEPLGVGAHAALHPIPLRTGHDAIEDADVEVVLHVDGHRVHDERPSGGSPHATGPAAAARS